MDTAIARPELLLVAEAVAREKNIDREEVLEAMEQAIQKAGRAKYGHEKDIRATIDRKTGDVRLSRWTEIVDTVENEETQMGKADAAKLFPDKSVGDHVVDPPKILHGWHRRTTSDDWPGQSLTERCNLYLSLASPSPTGALI